MILQIKRTWDVELIFNVLHNEIIWGAITEDEAGEFYPEVIKEIWLCLYTEEYIVGVYRLHAVNSITWQIHINILPKYRKEHSDESVTLVYRWCLENIIGRFLKMVCVIPKKYKNVYRFAKSHGFQDEGFNRDSFLKDGIIQGQHLLGITGTEIETFLKGK